MEDAKPNPEEPQKPCCNGEGDGKSSRRDFLLKLGLGLNVVAGGMIALPIAGFALSSFAGKYPPLDISLGPVDKFPIGKTRLASFRNPEKYSRAWDGETADIPCWVRRIDETTFQIFAINCAHLGCPVRWFEESKLFLCPCHGGAYYEDGSRAAGPPPRGLYTYDYRITDNNLIIKGGVLPTLANPNP